MHTRAGVTGGKINPYSRMLIYITTEFGDRVIQNNYMHRKLSVSNLLLVVVLLLSLLRQ